MAKENKRDVVSNVVDGLALEPTGYATLLLVVMWTIGAPLMLLYLIIKYLIKGTIKLLRKINKKREA